MKERITKLSKKIIQHELIKGSSYLFLGTFLANILAFLFNLLVIRKLNYQEYGEYASLISLLILVTVPSGAITTIIMRFATDFFSKKEYAKAKKLYTQTTIITLIISFLLFAVFLVFSNGIKTFLHIHDTLLIVWVGAMVVVTYMTIVNSSFIQSLLRFDFIALITIVNAGSKLLFGYTILYFGFKLQGMFFVMFFSMFLGYLISFFPLKVLWNVFREDVHIPIKEIILYSLPTSITVLALSSLTSTDVILVKHFFSAEQAGIYSGLSLVGRVIFYFTGIIPSVMFPLLIRRYNEKKSVSSLLFMSLGLVLLPSLAITGFYMLFPKIAITIFLGGRAYLSAEMFLGLFGLFITEFSAINLLTSFFLSLKKMGVAYIVSLGALLQIACICLFHNSFLQVILDSLISLLVILSTLLLYYLGTYEKKPEKAPDLINNPSI